METHHKLFYLFFNFKMQQNVHRIGLENPPTQIGRDATFIRGAYDYYHYLCDQFDDRGWGCGYRTLQEMIHKL